MLLQDRTFDQLIAAIGWLAAAIQNSQRSLTPLTETAVTTPIIIVLRFAKDQQMVILSYIAHLYSRGKAVSVNGNGWQQVVFYYHIANIVFAFGRGLFKGFKKNLFLFKKYLS